MVDAAVLLAQIHSTFEHRAGFSPRAKINGWCVIIKNLETT